MRRIFLVGVPRSGTTLLQSLIGCSPDVVTFTESHFFAKGFTARLGRPILIRSPAKLARGFCLQNRIDPAVHPEFGAFDWLRAELDPAVAVRYFIGVLDWCARRRSAQSWLEKTPSHLYFIDLIERTLKDDRPHFIHLVRDGIDVSASLAAAWRKWAYKRPISNALRLWSPITADAALRRWQSDLLVSLRFAGRPNHHVVIYEDLVAAPEDVSQRLARKLAIRLSKEDLAPRSTVLEQIIAADEEWKTEAPRQEVVSRGDGTKYLSGDERAALERTIDRSAYLALKRQSI